MSLSRREIFERDQALWARYDAGTSVKTLAAELDFTFSYVHQLCVARRKHRMDRYKLWGWL